MDKNNETNSNSSYVDPKKNFLLSILSKVGFDIPILIQESFLGYKYRKRTLNLYEKTAVYADQLIRLYYSLNPGEIEFDTMKKNFISKYVKNESLIEGVNDTDIHGQEEIEGLADMYEYLHSDEMEEYFSVYSLKDLHKKLFGRTPFPEYAGRYRTGPVYLEGSGVGLCDYSMVEREMYALSGTIDYLHNLAKYIRTCGNVDELLDYLNQVVELKCKLIWIHPFQDGNGRTIRAFINKLLEDAGLPPVYIKSNERTEYHKAMNQANGDEHDYTAIKAFYHYKICDSILELDINDRIRRSNKEIQKRKKKNGCN